MRAQTGTRVSRPIGRLALLSAALVILAACQQGRESGSQEMQWARAALERNPNLEIVASDASSGVFTVRERTTGQVHAVKLDEIAAAPVAMLAAAPGAAKIDRGSSDTEVHTAASDEAMSDESATEPAAEPEPATSNPPTPLAEGKDYTVQRSGNQVKVSGPGFSIVSGGAAPTVSAKGEPGQRTVDPIICEGQRMMHLDGRSIYVEGDAITVRGGCELYITNSRIVASGTGVLVREGSVHIANSYVEGLAASFDAGGDAKLYLRDSIFQGVSRRESVAMVEDQGGNRGLPTL